MNKDARVRLICNSFFFPPSPEALKEGQWCLWERLGGVVICS